MKKRIFAAALIATLGAALLAGCGSSAVSYADGTYTGTSSVYTNDDGTDDGNGYGVVTITITDGAISACEFVSYETDGTLKDEDYGMEGGQVANRDYYNKAQKAVAACPEYASALVEAGSLDGVDCISGATVNYNSFTEAVKDALSQAAE